MASQERTRARVMRLIGPVRKGGDVGEVVRRGIPASRIARFVSDGYASTSIVKVVGAPSTVQRKMKNDSLLSEAESDRLARVARVVALAEEMFGSAEKASKWMQRPTARMDRRGTPLSMLDTDDGAKQVEEWLYQIGYGMYA